MLDVANAMSTTRGFRASNQPFVSKLSSAKPRHALLDSLPSSCEADGSAVVQNRQDEVCDGPDEANSDSGDSLFITQKPVHEAVRSRKRRSPRLSSSSKSQQEEAETSPFLSSSDEEQKKKRTFTVPKFRFSFLTNTSKRKPVITNAKQVKLQFCAMGGFFSSVHDLWKSFELGGDLAESLPTVDTDGESISPISEEEEEETEDEDIKVVERTRFVTSLRATRSQPWNSLNKRSSKQRRHVGALNESQEEQRRTVRKVLTKMPLKEMRSSAVGTSDDGAKGLGTIRPSSPQEAGSQTERPNTKSPLKNIQERLLSDGSDPTKMMQVTQTALTPIADDLHMDEQNTPQRDLNETLSSKSEVKKRKKKDKCVEEGMEQSQETQGQRDAVPSAGVDITEQQLALTNEQDASVSNRKKKKKKSAEKEEKNKREQSDEELEEDAVGSSKTGTGGKKKKKRNGVGMECVKTGTAAEPPTGDGNIKKKKKKKKHLSSDVPQTSTEHRENLENTEASQKSVESNFTKIKKKKKSAKEEIVVQQGQSNEEVEEDSEMSSQTGTGRKERKKRNNVGMESTAVKPPTDDGNIKKKKHLSSDVPQSSTEHREYLENPGASQESMESNLTKRKKKKKSAFEPQIGEDCVAADVSNDAATLETNADITVKKKKKKRGISETEDISHTAEEDTNIDDTQEDGLEAKRKTKKKKRGNSSKVIQENILEPVEYSVSVQKKKTRRTSSFLTADDEENNGQAHEKHLPDVGVDALVATSADVTGSLGESKDRGKKKKATRHAGLELVKRELEFKESKETTEVVKKKKKRKRNDSVLMSSTERLESLADAEDSKTHDESVVLSKKKKKYAKEARETPVQRASLPSNKPGNRTPKGTDDKHLLKAKSFTKTVTSKDKTEPAAASSFNSSDNFLSKPETSSIRQKNKPQKRRLFCPNQDLLTDC